MKKTDKQEPFFLTKEEKKMIEARRIFDAEEKERQKQEKKLAEEATLIKDIYVFDEEKFETIRQDAEWKSYFTEDEIVSKIEELKNCFPKIASKGDKIVSKPSIWNGGPKNWTTLGGGVRFEDDDISKISTNRRKRK